MGNYTKTGPFNSGAAPGIDSGFLNNVETCLVGGGMLYYLGSPYQLTTNPTVTSGSTSTLTCTGVGGIPSGALAVQIGGGIFAATTGGWAWVSPHGGTPGQYVGVAGLPSNAFSAFSFTCPLDSTGKIDVKANSSNIVLQSWYIYAYII